MPGPVFATKEYVDGKPSPSRLVASLNNINLKDVNTNTLIWEDNKSIANTINHSICFKYVSGTYENQSLPAVRGEGSISIDSGCTGNFLINLNGGPIASTSAGALNQADTIQAIRDELDLLGYSTTLLGNVITFFEPLGEEGNLTGQSITVSGGNAPTSSLIVPFAGGSPEAFSETRILINSIPYRLVFVTDIMTLFAFLDNTKQISSTLHNLDNKPIFPLLGDIEIEVITGLTQDFIIDVSVYADTI